MRLGVSVAASDRAFGKAMHRVRPLINSLAESFEGVELLTPIHEALLVVLADDLPAEAMVEVQNRDGYFQVIAGMGSGAEVARLSPSELMSLVFLRVSRAASLCPFSRPDRERIEAALVCWRLRHLEEIQCPVGQSTET